MRPAAAYLALFLACQQALAGALEGGLSSYRHGRYEEALMALKPLARQGDPYAQFSLAVMYDDGLGLPRDLDLALFWYTSAARAGLADAQYMAGLFHGGGRGVRQDSAAALFWLELAAAAGHPLAPPLRDQHWSQLSRPARTRVAARAASWQAAHPRQFTCASHACIYPRWTARPRWKPWDPDPILPP